MVGVLFDVGEVVADCYCVGEERFAVEVSGAEDGGGVGGGGEGEESDGEEREEEHSWYGLGIGGAAFKLIVSDGMG